MESVKQYRLHSSINLFHQHFCEFWIIQSLFNDLCQNAGITFSQSFSFSNCSGR